MKRFRKIAAAVKTGALVLLMTLAMAVPAFADFDQSVLDGVVLIYSGAPDSTGNMQYWRGTGFFVGEEGQNPEYIITNCHVIEDYILAGEALGGGELYVMFDESDQQEAYLVVQKNSIEYIGCALEEIYGELEGFRYGRYENFNYNRLV